MIQAPKNSGSLYFNYKEIFLMAAHVMLIIGNNANCMSKYNLSTYCTIIYRVILIIVEQARKYSDSGALDNSAFGQAILPIPTCLPGTTRPELSYIMVGDKEFPLRNYFPGGKVRVISLAFV